MPYGRFTYRRPVPPDRPAHGAVGDPQRGLRPSRPVGLQPAVQRRAADHHLRAPEVGQAARPGLSRRSADRAGLGQRGPGSTNVQSERNSSQAPAARAETEARVDAGSQRRSGKGNRAMRVIETQEQIGRGEYRVDTQAVADAIIRRLAGRAQAPSSESSKRLRASARSPSARPSASAKSRPARSLDHPPDPRHRRLERSPVASGCGARRRRQAHAELVVLAGGRREARRVGAQLPCTTSATPGASGSAPSSSSIRTPPASARWRASVAIPSEMSIIAVAPSALSARPSATRGSGAA